MSFLKACSLTEVPKGTMKQVTIDELDLAVYHTDQGVYVTSDICTHARAYLTDGTLDGCIVECPRHGGKFDVRTGKAKALPCVIPVETFPSEVRGEDVWVDV